MLSGHCFKENCQEKPFAKCDCQENVLFCQAHALEHLTKPSPKRHQCIPLDFKPAEESKQPVILKLKELRKGIQILKKRIILDASEINKNFEAAFKNYYNKINDFDKRCSKIIVGLANEKELPYIANEKDIESVLKLNPHDAKIKMEGWSANWCCLDYHDINAAINKIYEISFNPLLSSSDEIESSELSFFNNDTSEFITIDLSSFNISSKDTLETQENVKAYASKCMLPDKTYFYCCNPDSTTGMAFTIDKNKNVKQLKKSNINYHLDAVFYNNFIYLLGGNNKLAERYSLEQDCWESMAP